MTSLAFLTGVLSRNAGGLYDAMRWLARSVADEGNANLNIFGLSDAQLEADMAGWGPLKVSAFSTIGPNSFGYAPELISSLREFAPQIVHVHGIWMYYSVANSRLHCSLSVPYVISPHGMLDGWALDNSGWKKRLAGFVYENRHLRNAACIHALCPSEMAAIRDYGLRNPICVIPNGVHLPAQTDLPVPEWRKSLPHNAKVLLFLGRIHPKKGLIPLLNAWNAAKSSRPEDSPWHLVVAGWDQGGHQAELSALVEQLEIGTTVHFIGPQFNDDKSACYRHSDAFVLTSYSEGLPMTILDAWANRLPVLMTPECNIPEGYLAGAAIRVETDPSSIAQGLLELFDMSDAQLESMGHSAHTLVTNTFTWAEVAKKMVQVYEWILGVGPVPECVHTT